MEKRIRLISRLLFLPYTFMVLWITLINRTPTYRRSMLSLFWEYRYMIYGDHFFFFAQIAGNILMLIPFGILLPAMFRKMQSAGKVVFLGAALSIFIELTQYYTARGLCEFDDVFNNTLGAAVGFCIWKFLYCKLLYPKKLKEEL